MADEILVMKDGRVLEHRPTEALLAQPHDEYTRRLISSVPRGRPRGHGSASGAGLA
jgi:peptide/nickel transport system ATP-binding protein